MFAVYEPVMLLHNVRIGTFNCTITFAFILTRKTTGEAGFAELSLCIWQENSPERAAGRRFEGRLIGAVLLKPCSRQWKFPSLSMLSIC